MILKQIKTPFLLHSQRVACNSIRTLTTEAEATQNPLPSKLYFTTRDRVHGRYIEEELGLVSATAVRSKSLFSDLYVAVFGLIGGEAQFYTTLLNETLAEAVHRVEYAAQSQGATAVTNIRFSTNTTMNRLIFGLHCSVVCYGTAVRCSTRPTHKHHTVHQTDSQETVEAFIKQLNSNA